MTKVADRIRKTVVLDAPVQRVWSALSDAAQFGAWFGAEFDGPFVAGTRLAGRMVPTKADPVVARMQEPHAGTRFAVYVEHVEPQRLLSFRWHPYAVDDPDDATAPTTLVEFRLEAVAEGTRLTVTESGFDGVALDRRAQAFDSNEQGWVHQMALIAKYLAMTA